MIENTGSVFAVLGSNSESFLKKKGRKKRLLSDGNKSRYSLQHKRSVLFEPILV